MKPCHMCKHYQHGHMCRKKNQKTETARLVNTERVDCWEVRRVKK